MSENYEYSDISDAESVEWSGDSSEAAYSESSENEWSEARRRPGPVRTAPRQSAYRPRPSGTTNYVTQAQLQGALARVSQQITLNGNAIKLVDGRVRDVIAEQGKQAATFRREMADRRKDTDTLRRELQTTRELSALLPLVAPPGTSFAKVASLVHLLPVDSWGGTPASGGQSQGFLGGSGTIALIAIAAASGVFK
ncbi:hypothetical protein C2L64_44975 [Paraburkholderia hospita]|uniref:Uncharacterized protein n=1 Tax=Paraburkholderia hospita TaxID=169430 RepID=A0AAN1MQM2_9BURK|nr:hypothetical protein [Paraburkholderia hospita]AUT75536.1 hypothetical protein C2L64_44975 [Paraburkholderia hospita]